MRESTTQAQIYDFVEAISIKRIDPNAVYRGVNHSFELRDQASEARARADDLEHGILDTLSETLTSLCHLPESTLTCARLGVHVVCHQEVQRTRLAWARYRRL